MSVVAELNMQIKKFVRERISANSKPESSKNSGGNGSLRKVSCHKNYLFVPNHGRSSRQTGVFLTPGNILSSFDLCSALRDIRRFQYVCRLLDIIIENHFTTLSGSAFNNLFCVFEEAVSLATRDQLFIKQIVGILSRAHEKMKLNYERIVGSVVANKCRMGVLDSWVKEIRSTEMVSKEDDGKPTLMDLPEECQRVIFRCLADPADIIHLSQTCSQLYIIGSEDLLWEELFWYHFTEAQLPMVPMEDCRRDWKAGFQRLLEHHSLKVEYVTMMARCSYCSCVYWQGSEHPCPGEMTKKGENSPTLEHRDRKVEILSPRDLMSIF